MEALSSLPGGEAAADAHVVDYLQALPPDWVSFLEPYSFAALQCTAAGHRLTSSDLVSYWSSLCALRLGLHSRCQVEISKGDTLDPQAWSRAYRSLTAPGLSCELVHREEDYAKLPSADEGECPPEAVEFLFDDRGLCTRCRLRPSARIGGNRIVVASSPLPVLHSHTPHAFCDPETPESWRWQILQRTYNYYEVSFSESKPTPRTNQLACVSVGLCTQHLTASMMQRQQAGWNLHSWALHGDDGNIYHGSGMGVPFHIANSLDADPPSRRSRRVTFGAGDVVGCGITAFSIRGSSRCGIYFTLNGDFLGIGFFLPDSYLNLPHGYGDDMLRPCVGIDAHWLLDFNFGQRPFRCNVGEALAGLDMEVVARPPSLPVSQEESESEYDEEDEFDDEETEVVTDEEDFSVALRRQLPVDHFAYRNRTSNPSDAQFSH